jgi:hypothetical protein
MRDAKSPSAATVYQPLFAQKHGINASGRRQSAKNFPLPMETHEVPPSSRRQGGLYNVMGSDIKEVT